jgi:hypothetical protein
MLCLRFRVRREILRKRFLSRRAQSWRTIFPEGFVNSGMTNGLACFMANGRELPQRTKGTSAFVLFRYWG